MNNVAHFAIHSDDIERAKEFYAEVFGWKFNPYGPPGFYQIQTGPDETPGIRGALQERLVGPGGEHIHGFECSISVESLDDTFDAVVASGGKIVLDKCTIPNVGSLFKFTDTEGNLVVAMQYEIDLG
ncbi:MAG: VOC family protein [Pseudomonadales bacterium]|jgi:predicted enzyme related to lactoylglutathione lyase